MGELTERILISEEWLKEVGFKWHQIDRQPEKQWCLWLGGCMECPPDGETEQQRWRFTGDEDFGIELAHNFTHNDDYWFCWFRGDSAGRYHRFIHVRHLRWQHEVIALVEALGGRSWHPERHWYGSVKCLRHAEACAAERSRLDIVANKNRATWYEAEKDDTRDRALPEHLDEAIKSGRAS